MIRGAVVGLIFVSGLVPAASPEWGQWAGPNRNFQVTARPFAQAWPQGGPRVVWRQPMPFGSSSVAVDHGRLYTMYRDGDNETVVALDAGTGKTVWEYKYPAVFLKGMNMNTGPGPHATPLVDGDRLYTAGVTGKFHCLNKKTGKVLWIRGLIEELGGSVMLRGYSNSPLHYQDTVIVMVGGEEQVACVLEKAVAGFDPASGRLLWSHPHENRGGDITSTLIWGADNLLFFSGAYQGGSRTLQLSRENGATVVKQLWFHSQLRVHHTNVMRIGDYVYASNGDFGGTIYLCLNIRTGQILWRERSMPRANALLVGDRAILLD